MLRWLFRRTPRARPVTDADLMAALIEQRRRIDMLEEQLEVLTTREKRFEGRVYAWFKKTPPVEDGEAAPVAPATETTDQLRQRLLREGKLVPGKPYKHDA